MGYRNLFVEEVEDFTGVSAVIVKTLTRVDNTFLAKYPKVKLVIRAGSGYDNIDLEAAINRGITVCNTPEANALSAAEHTISLIFSLIKRLQGGKENLVKKKWKENLEMNFEAGDLKLLVIGVGRIGTRVARTMQTLGATVKGVDPYLSDEVWAEKRILSTTFLEGVSWCNMMSFHCPLNTETYGYFNQKTLSMLRSPIWLINTARGGIIDENAIEIGLETGMIRGVGLDVYCQEPNPHLAFVNLPNIILTPHTGAYTERAKYRIAHELLDVWKSFFIDKNPINILTH